MAKTAQKTQTSDVFAFPGVENVPFADQFRSMAEQSMSQSKEAYDTMKTSVEEAQKAVETTMESAQNYGSKMSLSAINAMRANAELGFAHMEKLVGVKTLAEAFEVQTSYFRKQAELAADQAKEWQDSSKEAFEAVSAPAKAQAEKAMATVKNAA